MAIKRIEINNMAAFEHLELDLDPEVVLIEGGNGVGKTSFQECVRYVADRGHDPDIVHGTAEFGDIVITFTDGNMVKARATRTETTRGWKPAGGKKWIMNRELIDKICNAIGYNPLGFLKLAEKQQAEELLRIVPMEVPVQALQDAVAEVQQEAALADMQPGATALEIITAVHKALYDARRTLNGSADTLEKFVTQSESLQPPPAPDGEDWSTEAVKVQEKLEEFDEAERKRLAAIDKVLAERIEAERNRAFDDKVKIEQEIDAKIRELETERSRRKSERDEALTAAVTDLQTRAGAKQREIQQANAGNRQTLHSALATAQERARAQQQADGARKEIEKAKVEAKAARERSGKLTAAMDKLGEVKAGLLEKLPVPGVTVENGRIVRQEAGGTVPLKKWNTEAQNRFCLRLAMLVNSEAGFTVIDDAEHFDPSKFAGLVNTAKKYSASKGVQFIIARVTEGPMEVNGKAVGK